MRSRLATLLILPFGWLEAQKPPPTWQLSERPLLSIGSTDSGPELFGRIAGAVRLSSGAVLVADRASNQLRLFSSAGRLMRTVGRYGGGPGEFRSIGSIRRCAGDTIFVDDGGNGRISVFSPTGSYVRAFDPRSWSVDGMPPYDFWCNTTGTLAAIHRSPEPPAAIGPRRPNIAITLITPNGALVKLGTFPAPERYFLGEEDIPRPLGKPTSIALGSNAAYVGTGDAFEVLELSLRGERVGTIRDARRLVPVTSAHVTRYIADLLDRSSGRGLLDRKTREMLYKNLEYPRWFPSHGRLLVDGSDNLWIEDYPIPGAEEHRWSVFTSDRVAIALIRVPGRFEILEIGTDYVLGIWRDELDVEYVRLYGLVR